MTFGAIDEVLVRATDESAARPIPAGLLAARADVVASISSLATISDAALTRPWAWTGESEEEVRYGFYRIAEIIELAEVEAADRLRSAGRARGRAGDRIAPATAAVWDLRGLLATVSTEAWDTDPGGEEWTIRQTVGHVLSGQRAYGVGTGWWLERDYRIDDLSRPSSIPDDLWDDLPSEEAEADGPPADVVERLTTILDAGTERLAGLPAERLVVGARWGGYPIDIDFRLGRWSSHIREHTIQVEKTFAMLDHVPSEVDRLIRLILVGWGRAESVVYGASDAEDAIAALATGAGEGRAIATELAANVATDVRD
jgi:hypothetical protein